MKTKYLILLSLLLLFSLANSQSNTEEILSTTAIPVTTIDKEIPIAIDNSTPVINKNVKSNATPYKDKQTVARSSNDLRIYLNRFKSLQNIRLLFPKINREEMT